MSAGIARFTTNNLLDVVGDKHLQLVAAKGCASAEWLRRPAQWTASLKGATPGALNRD